MRNGAGQLSAAILAAVLWFPVPATAQGRKLVVISIDGLDHRYLKDRDALRLRIPNLRKLVEEGSWANGVVGVIPTDTWPSHTTLITGVRSDQHGILENNVRTATGYERYWYTRYLKVPTLWQAARNAGKSVAAITWPVTVGDGIDYNLPEYFQGRAGGAMDLKSIEEKATPGLVETIRQQYPSFATEWMDDRTRALAAVFILKKYQPDLMLLHFVDHDSAAHDVGPFTREAIAALEYTDELIGGIVEALPPRTVVALVSDHGFEVASRQLNVAEFLKSHNLPAEGTETSSGYLSTADAGVAAALREAGARAEPCVGREIPGDEVRRFLPQAPAGLRFFEPAPGCYFTRGTGRAGGTQNQPVELGHHGYWPMRYRASFVLWGPGIRAERLPEMDMREAVKYFAGVLDLSWPPPR